MIDFSPPESPFRISYDGDFDISRAVTAPPPGAPSEREMRKELKRTVRRISRLQRRLHAHRHYAVLLVFQAMDAAGKDSTLRAVMTGVNPAGFRINAFEAPSNLEARHDFLWRTTRRLPEKGRIGIFNRSYYEEVLIVRVHPEYLDRQKLPRRLPIMERCEERYQSIRDHERHLARNGTVILKFWLNISKDEQARRFLRRIDRPDKNWKFNRADIEERQHWDDYMAAYEDAINATARPWAPWYAIPADSKPWMRLLVARLVRDQLATLDLTDPALPEDERAELQGYRAHLTAEL
ncbi:MAG: polyphosphate kinase 2 family protein [Gemmatimonadales bacterium]|nr:polyphosphate kinase 2 family protein [Gemmatimonadales bacterium]MYG49930.1 polyphosphate kinase 2 family protein [Gemmatimonadales bacterium]MYK01618.1 polyphosphate kinase 2 family protein [Candidatus Palauibacter ramosifaciens]